METVEPDFEEVKQVVVNKARTMERWELFIDKGHKGPGCIRCFDTPITAPMVITGQASAISNSLQERTTQTAKLTSVLNGQSGRFGQQSQAPEPRSISDLDQSWQRRCMWRDSIKHRRRNCLEFTEALNAKVIGFNEMGKIKVMSTGEELPLMFNKGGMRKSLKSRTATESSQSTTVSAKVGLHERPWRVKGRTN